MVTIIVLLVIYLLLFYSMWEVQLNALLTVTDAPKTEILLVRKEQTNTRLVIMDEPFKVVFKNDTMAMIDTETDITLNTNKTVTFLEDTVPAELKRVRGFSHDVFLFSAVVGNTSLNETWDVVTIQGWEHESFANTTFDCCINYKSSELLTVPMTQKIHWAYRDKTLMQAKQYICQNVMNIPDEVPVAVTIAGRTPATECHEKLNWYLVPYFAYKGTEQIAVCAKLAYGNLPADDILTWFEIHRRLGVSKVLVYTYNLNPEATTVLKYYQSIGLAETFPFKLFKTSKLRTTEIGVKNFQAWNDEQVPVFDCLEKLKGYKYIVVLDLDEYLIPKTDKTLMNLFNRLFSTKANAAGFTFLVQLHITSWEATSNSSIFKIGRYLNRTQTMPDRIKHVTMPDRLVSGGLSTHGFTPNWDKGFKRFRAAETDAVIHHFRTCRKEWNKKGRIKCSELERFTDTTLAEMISKIENDLMNLINSLHLVELLKKMTT